MIVSTAFTGLPAAALEVVHRVGSSGAPGVEATSIAAEGGDPVRERVDAALADSLGDRLGLTLEPATLDELLPLAAEVAS